MGETRRRQTAGGSAHLDENGEDLTQHYFTADEEAIRLRPKEGLPCSAFMLFQLGILACLGLIMLVFWASGPVQRQQMLDFRDKIKELLPKPPKNLDAISPSKFQDPDEFPPVTDEQLAEAHNWRDGPSSDPNLRLMTNDDIKYVKGGKLYLVVVGHVFDVSSGSKMYEPGSGYHAFIGRDASRAFVTGEFQEKGLVDDLSGLESHDYIGLIDWIKFYLTHDKYKFVGYHIGSYFDKNGKETERMAQLREWVKDAENMAEKEEDLKKLFPPCNVDWSAETGSRLWCSPLSGGIDRDWAGYPREFFEKADKPARCACVHPNHLADPRLKLYEDCEMDSDSCSLQPKK